jgi:hypothetical protein
MPPVPTVGTTIDDRDVVVAAVRVRIQERLALT